MSFNAVWQDSVEIGTAESSGTWTYSALCAGIESINFASNEQAQQFFFLCGNGGADNEVTAIAPELRVSGRRKVGDTAQDYIVGKQFALGDDRKSSVKITAEGKVITVPCTICDVVSFGGDAPNVNAFSCTLKFNGIPTVTNAQ